MADRILEVYTVKSGDNLSKISKKYYNDTSFATKIAEFNGIDDINLISVNQQLDIPDLNEIVRKHTIAKGDTLYKLAIMYLGDGNKYIEIAKLNNITDPSALSIGQTIQIPDESSSTKTAPIVTNVIEKDITSSKILVKVPHGFKEVIATFGDIRNYITSSGKLSPKWSKEKLITIDLPFPIPLAWDTRKKVTRMTCHVLLKDVFFNVFSDIQSAGLVSEIKGYGGTFNFRAKRSANSFSTHSWAIAIDLNPLTNGMGRKGDMHPEIVEIFRANGFKWGGDWTGRGHDPMHFQYCTGY